VPFVQSVSNPVGRKTLDVNPAEHLADHPSFMGLYSKAAGLAICSIHSLVPVAVGRVGPEVLFPVFDFVTAPPARAVTDQLALELSETPKDVNHQAGYRTRFGWQLPKYHAHILFLQVALDDAKVHDVAGQAVHVIDQNGLEAPHTRVIAQSVEGRAQNDATAPAFVLIHMGDDQTLRVAEA
jgi:hypothetical protein